MNVRQVIKKLQGSRGVSPVISSVILTGAVIVAGFVVLFWTQAQSSTYNQLYGDAVDADIARLKERVALEYTIYAGGTLRVYLINCGTIDDLAVNTVYISGGGQLVSIFSNIVLHDFDGAIINHLDRGEEGYFALSVTLDAGQSYSIRIITGRGSGFEFSFVA